METDWSVAAAGDDPIIEVGWADAASAAPWLDLRVAPELQQERISALPEVHHAPELARALAAWNAPAGLLRTVKCDAWPLSPDELADTADLLDAPSPNAGFASYVDALFAPPTAMADFLLYEEWARTTARRCAAASVDDARIELTVRPARAADTWGFGLTVYCYGVGTSAQHAHTAWARALDAIIPVLIAVADELLPEADAL